jgi:hypothetical protein
MKLDVRRTTPFTQDEYEAVQAFAEPGTPEHQALARVSPAPLRDGSEGSALRALALLGMEYVRERQAEVADLDVGYDELAADRRSAATPLRANMARRARAGAAPDV